MHINIVAYASLACILNCIVKIENYALKKQRLDKSQMSIYIYLNFSYKFITNSHFNFRPYCQMDKYIFT